MKIVSPHIGQEHRKESIKGSFESWKTILPMCVNRFDFSRPINTKLVLFFFLFGINHYGTKLSEIQ